MNFVEQLNAKGATPETLLQILKTSVFEASGDLSPDEMTVRLKEAIADPDEIDEALGYLASRPDVVREVALLWISHSSNDPKNIGVIEGAIAGADREMPLFEVGAIALVALYAIYMIGPDKPTAIRKVIKQRADGSYEEVEEKTFASFDAPIKGLIGIFSKNRTKV